MVVKNALEKANFRDTENCIGLFLSQADEFNYIPQGYHII